MRAVVNWSLWKHLFCTICDTHSPFKNKRVKGSLPKWITSDFLRLAKDRDYYYKRAHKTNNPNDWDQAKHLRNKVNNLNRNLKRKYCSSAINNDVNKPKKIWKTIWELIPKNKPNIERVYKNGELSNNDQETANEFNKHFTSVGDSLAKQFCDNSSSSTNNTKITLMN